MADASPDSPSLSLEDEVLRVLLCYSWLRICFLFGIFTRTLDRNTAIENPYVQGLFLRSLELVKVHCSVFFFFFIVNSLHMLGLFRVSCIIFGFGVGTWGGSH